MYQCRHTKGPNVTAGIHFSITINTFRGRPSECAPNGGVLRTRGEGKGAIHIR